MSNFTKISVNTLSLNPFETIGKDWFLITAQKDGNVNTMTASWGGLGILFGKPVAYIFIRPQRYTKEFIDANTHFSLSVLPDTYRKQLNYLGTVSGRDEDKIAHSGLHVQTESDVPYFEESKLVFLCKKLFAQEMKEASFIDPSLIEKFYPNKDFHTLYIAEIESILTTNMDN